MLEYLSLLNFIKRCYDRVGGEKEDVVDAVNIAKYIVDKCITDNQLITNLAVQKILFFIQKEFLKQTGDVAFYDEIQAWKYGPVVPAAYRVFCGFGAKPIFFNVKDYDDTFPKWAKKIIDDITVEKREVDVFKLVRETHKEKGAWKKAFDKGTGTVITKEMILEEIRNEQI